MSVTYVDGVQSPELARLQAVLTDMLARLLAYCEAHGIPIFLIGGTALGALRDGEMIPWDDDIDLALMREDYERLMDLLEREPIEGMTLQHWRTEPRYHYPYAKLRLDGTSAGELDFKGGGMHEGLFLDIFPYDRLPASESARAWQRRLLGLLNYVILPPALDVHFREKPLADRVLRAIGRGARRLFPLRWFVHLRERIQQPRSGPMSGEFDSFGMLGISQWRKKVLREEDFFPLRPVRFGPLEARIPANCERFCELHYGPDWGQPPPVHQRKPAHVGTIVLPDETARS